MLNVCFKFFSFLRCGFSLLAQDGADLVAELVTGMRMLRFFDLPMYRQGVTYLLTTQNKDGSWGTYHAQGKKWGTEVQNLFRLHTTGVALHALTTAFQLLDEPKLKPDPIGCRQ